MVNLDMSLFVNKIIFIFNLSVDFEYCIEYFGRSVPKNMSKILNYIKFKYK